MKKGLLIFALMCCCSLSAMAKVYNSGDLSPCDDKMCEQSGDLANGVLTEYHENGNLKYETPYKNGVREGLAKEYYENGNMKWEIISKAGKAISGVMYEMYSGKKQEMTNAHLHNAMKELP